MEQEIDRQIGAASAVLRALNRSVVRNSELSRKAKLSIFQSIYVPILTYGYELGNGNDRKNEIGAEMEVPMKQQLLETLQDLGEEELKLFQWYLQDAELLDGFPAIKKCHLENAGRLKTVDLMVDMYTTKDVMQVAKLILKNRNEGKPSQVGPQDSPARTASAAETLDKWQPKLKSNLKKKFQCVFEGIAKAGNPTLLNQIYTELYITEGRTGKVNDEHEIGPR
ncbi:uncharacterized protein LOC111645516 [Seriola lalandi dorsalis]|uniref:uncharacterized protein LOC111645516 n=1 Tax=Seriola lalandi dorsalis TaxID=1841481 RepID=UPI000C6F5FEE|nr:uncharacterized protein LOC111645516 [Seriola lalandi dorsalis]